jgi:hypothetical protein
MYLVINKWKPEPSDVFAALALVVAASVGGLTVVQGRAIRRIETREHEWEKVDRRSAHIRVTRESVQRPATVRVHGSTEPAASFANVWYIRLTNTGRVPASEVDWSVEYTGANEDTLAEALFGKVFVNHDLTKLDELHPGEHFDLLMKNISVDEGQETIEFTVSWDDERSPPRNKTTRLINW